MKPRILIARSESNGADAYVRSMYGVGCIADSIYAPPVSDRYDGLILAGGGDLDPALYGEKINGSKEIDKKRDVAELALCEKFVKQGKPILGICRGHQLLNVYFGGTLIQHIDSHVSNDSAVYHEVEAAEGSIMYKLFGKSVTVNSIHHQAVGLPGEGFSITQRSPDGIIEAIEHDSLPVLAVQWHPERLCLDGKRENAVDSLPIFEYFASLLK